ncbi:MAG: apolipoprotein N-acyltransferase [Thermoanaerobaculia bacterium]
MLQDSPSERNLLAGVGLACLSGFLHFTLIPPLSWHWMAWVVLVPFLWSLTGSSAMRGAALGAAFGVQLSAAVYWWLPGLLVRFFHLPVIAAWVAGVLGAFFLAVPYAAFGSWVACLSKHGRASPFSIAAGWVLAEFASGRWLIPNRLGLLAHSQIGSNTSQIVDLVGQYGLGFLIVAVNAVALRFLKDRSWKSVAQPTSLVIVAGLASTVLYGSRQREDHYGDGGEVQVAVLQGGVQLEFDQRPDERFENFDHYKALTSKATTTDESVDIVFWPEWAAGVYLGDSSEEAQEHLAALASFGPELVLGAPHREQVGEQRSFYNSVFLVRKGSIEGRYDKQKLIPLAESDPLARLGGVLNRPSYTPGLGPSILPTLRGKIGVMICSESTSPVVARELVRLGAEILANPSNDYWFGRREPAQLQLGVAGLRAIENRRYLARPTSTGLSAVIDPAGTVVVESSSPGSEVLLAEVRPVSVVTMYQRVGDFIVWISVCLAGWHLLAPRVRKHDV